MGNLGEVVVAEAWTPIGTELEDCQVRKMLLPLSLDSEHAGSISFRLFLREGYAGDEPADVAGYTGSFVSKKVLQAVGDAVGQVRKSEGIAITANLLTRDG